MKKTLALLLALAMVLSMCACGASNNSDATTATATNDKATENVQEEKPAAMDLKDFPYIGTWANEEGTVYLRVKEDGVLLGDSVLTSSSTSTVNGVTTSSTSKSIVTNTYTWSVEKDLFLFNGLAIYTPTIEDGQYTLVSDKQTYYRVGDLDYVIPLTSDDDANKKDVKEDAEKYALGTPIVVEGVEMTLDECGITDDIRVTSKSSGIQITSGPSVEAGKQYVYLKGTLKNTGYSSTRAVIGGIVYLDNYEFNLRTDTIKTSGSPSSSIDPMETVHILLYAQVSNEMAGMFSDGKLIFGFNDNFANVELERAQHLYYVDINR